MSTEAISTGDGSAVTTAAVAALIPLQHHEAFHSLTKEEQERVGLLVNLLGEMETAPEGITACSERLALEISQRGFTAKNLQALFQKWRRNKKDWRVLVRNYRGPSALPPAFVEFLRMTIEQNSRCASQAMAQIKARFAAAESIPGYGTWREWYASEFPELDVPQRYPLGVFPRGWGRSNLYTKQSSRAQRMLKRRGFAAAKRYLPCLQRDMSGLLFLQLIVIDDFETDIAVLARHPETGRYENCTCTGLLAMDAATRTMVGFGLKPRFRSDEGKRIGITRRDVQELLYSVFSEHGLPAGYGCTIQCENSAAAITPEFELALQNILGVQVTRTGLINDKTLKNGFVQSGGKPWEKGLIESTFNLVHNMAGAMPGQKGASYQLKPADLEAKLLYVSKLIAIEGLSDETISQLHTPLWRYEQALDGYGRIFRILEQRTKHHLQGFREVVDFLLPDGSAVITEEQLMRSATGDITQYQPVARMESPAERKARLIAGQKFVKIAEHALALLLLTPKKIELRNHKLTFVHGAIGYTFADADSPVMDLQEGTELLGYFDGADARELYCTDLRGRFIGKVKRRGAAPMLDARATGIEAGEVARLITKIRANVEARHAGENAQLAADDAHNFALLTAAGVSPEDMPARLLPKTNLPPVHAAPRKVSPDNTADSQRPAPVASSSISAVLSRPALSRDAFAAKQENAHALAHAVAATGQKAEADAALSQRSNLNPDDIL